MKKLFSACLASVVLACGLLLAGCGMSDEEAITNGLTEDLEKIKTLDSELLSEFEDDASFAQLEAYGLDVQEFMASYFDGFDYGIKDVMVDGDKATATLVLTTKSLESYENNLEDLITKNISEMPSYGSDEFNKFIGKIALDALNQTEAKKSDPIKLELQKSGNTWDLTSDSESNLEKAMMGL